MTQEQALSILKTGANVFLTGEPGSGKSYTVNKYVDYLRRRGIEPAITASTGIAATHINGRTLHSWSGIGINKSLSADQIAEVADKKSLNNRIASASVLIIDEVSMLDAAILNLAEAVIRKVKNVDQPWGGLQIVFVGDFFQLPPVARADQARPLFAFQSPAWQKADVQICYLSEQHRQDDQQYLSLLTSVRQGNIGEDVHKVLQICKNKTRPNSVFTKLFSHNVDVDQINQAELEHLSGKQQQYQMESFGSKTMVEQLKRGCLSPENLFLKAGAKVMFTKNNFEKGFVNGTLGEVVKFSENGLPVVKTARGFKIEVEPMEWKVVEGARTLARIVQMPLRLAWAITVHKSQGMTLDHADIDLSGAFEFGQGYVALSRVRALDGLFLRGWNQRALEVHPDILEKDLLFREGSGLAQKNLSSLPESSLIAAMKNFIARIGGHWEEREPQATAVALRSKRQNGDTYKATLVLWDQGQAIEKIAQTRGLKAGTVISHIEELFMRGQIKREILEERMLSAELSRALPEVSAVFKELGSSKLSPVFKKLNGKYTYDQLRLCRLMRDS